MKKQDIILFEGKAGQERLAKWALQKDLTRIDLNHQLLLSPLREFAKAALQHYHKRVTSVCSLYDK